MPKTISKKQYIKERNELIIQDWESSSFKSPYIRTCKKCNHPVITEFDGYKCTKCGYSRPENHDIGDI